jgi:hypothetical protein
VKASRYVSPSLLPVEDLRATTANLRKANDDLEASLHKSGHLKEWACRFCRSKAEHLPWCPRHVKP